MEEKHSYKNIHSFHHHVAKTWKFVTKCFNLKYYRLFGAEEISSLVEAHSREGSGTPLQYSCLENPMDGGAW